MSENNKKSKYNFASLSMKTSAILLSSLMLMQSVPFANLAKAEEDAANTQQVYKLAPTSAYKIKKDDLEHVYLTSYLSEQGQNNEVYANRYVKLIPLTDENANHEQEWAVVFNAGMHDELFEELKKGQIDPNFDRNDGKKVVDTLNNKNLNFTSNPWFSVMLSKDMKIVGNYDFYMMEPLDKQYGQQYMGSFDDIVKRAKAYNANDKIFVADKTSMDPYKRETHIVDVKDNSDESLKMMAHLTPENFNSNTSGYVNEEWTKWASNFLENDQIRMQHWNYGDSQGEDSFELKQLSFASKEEIQNKYNPTKKNAGYDSNSSVGHFILNDMGYGMRFQYKTGGSSRDRRIVVIFKTKRDPMAFFKDEKWNMVRRDANNRIQAFPESTFVAAGFKSYDNAQVRQQVDVAVPSSVFVDTDGDNLRDYYEKLLGTDPNSEDTNNDSLSDFDHFYKAGPTQLKNLLKGQGGPDGPEGLRVDGIGEYPDGQISPRQSQVQLGHLVKGLWANPSNGNNPWSPEVKLDKGMSKILASDPASANITYEIPESSKQDGKLKYAIGSMITGTASPYATVGLYTQADDAINGQAEKRDLNVIAETVADKMVSSHYF